jgi:hypothetical protein
MSEPPHIIDICSAKSRHVQSIIDFLGGNPSKCRLADMRTGHHVVRFAFMPVLFFALVDFVRRTG